MLTTNSLYVVNRKGEKEEVHFDKITDRISELCHNLDMDFIDPVGYCMYYNTYHIFF